MIVNYNVETRLAASNEKKEVYFAFSALQYKGGGGMKKIIRVE